MKATKKWQEDELAFVEKDNATFKGIHNKLVDNASERFVIPFVSAFFKTLYFI